MIPLFKRILVANRGEIAVRVIRACRDMGIGSVAVYSDADTQALHVRLADEAVHIGASPGRRSYLDQERLLDAARRTGCEALHPGYGYLAEHEGFARACLDAGLVFVGPTPENLRLAGDKLMARDTARRAGVPVLPGNEGALGDLGEASDQAGRLGYPVMLKARAGGGGRGIRVCRNAAELAEAFPMAAMEAGAAFGDPSLYLETRLEGPRHIEVQILADEEGRVVHMGERECTIQRRYQKLLEESPSPGLTPGLREEMAQAALRVARAFGYANAGTVEFLLDTRDRFYFMELNARIQVEHPITEVRSSVDLVREQIRLARGLPLGYGQEEVLLRGWAMECRINAEDPDRSFRPSPGVISEFRPPGGFGVRVDTHLYPGYELPIYYDSLVAKCIAGAPTREGAIAVMKRALGEFAIGPVRTTIPLLRRILDDPKFQEGAFDTGFLKRFVAEEEDEDA